MFGAISSSFMLGERGLNDEEPFHSLFSPIVDMVHGNDRMMTQVCLVTRAVRVACATFPFASIPEHECAI